MSTTPEQIDLWRQSPSEHQRLEFKEAKNQYDFAKLCQYCVALANEGGGFFLLGLEDKPPRRVVGTQACRNAVGMAEKLFEAVGFRVDVEEVAHPEGRVVVLHIPSRPAGTAYHLGGAYLMRSGEALVPMSEDQLRRIFAEGPAPAPNFRSAHRRTVVTIYAQKPFEDMDRDDRIRACYQHCALKWVMSERMTNQSLRERFRLPEARAASVSQVISATAEVGLIKPDEKVGASRRFARYLPFWA